MVLLRKQIAGEKPGNQYTNQQKLASLGLFLLLLWPKVNLII